MSRRLLLGLILGIVALVGLDHRPASAQGEPVKPYVFLIVDTSGSMDASTGQGPPSCGGIDQRLDHAKCAIYNVAASYGDMVLGLGRFRLSTTDTNCANGCSMSGIECGSCNNSTGSGCTATMSNPGRLEVLTGLVDGANEDVITWTNFTCGTCGTSLASDPDIYIGGWTPVAGALKGAKAYFQGDEYVQSSTAEDTLLWDDAAPGFDPIRNDPLKDVFLPSGEQCRPYIVIMLTDGDETCTTFANTEDAAEALLTTVVDGQTYRIETKPIGFGQSPGDTQIEGLAHAGGATNVTGVNEGFYAQNEEDLQIAISSIIADAIKFEQCNDLDDDCDLLIDEDFPNKGGACDNGLLGVCRGTGSYVCNGTGTGTECMITDPGELATSETCDGEDDDCDGFVDEGACMGCSGVELCNGMDDDCDIAVDEDLTRACGTDIGVCEPGTETCVDGAWVGCDASPLPGTETCNGLDDDCNGTPDGFAESCTSLPPPGNPNTGPCRPGTRVCPPDGSGEFGACIGEVVPVTEVCNLVDDDCDGTIDEDTGGADCSSSCGVGTTQCVNGVIECDAMPATDDETCNGFDDDCDGQTDEDAPPGPACDNGGQLCNGQELCIGGDYVCVGETAEPELCNCEDDDCDVQVDEDTCGGGSTCVNPADDQYDCQCAQPCAGGEFPCPVGRVCVDDFCLVDPCFGVSCGLDGDGNATECVGGECVAICDSLNCPAPLICYGPEGECRPDDCTTFPERCTGEQLCVGGACVSDPCAGVTCSGEQYCFDGDCVGSCAGVDCPSGQECRFGACVDVPCPTGCPGGQVCNPDSGACVDDECGNQMCPQGEVCDPLTGDCVQDPCVGVECPGEQVCSEGSCFAPDDLVDAGVDADTDNTYVSAAGGGGCAAGGGAGGGAAALALLALALGLATRRRRAAGGAA